MNKAIALILGIPCVSGMYIAYLILIRGDGFIFAAAASAVTALIVKILSTKDK